MTDIVSLLGADANSLLEHRCQTIPSENLYLPGSDFVDRVMIDNNRPNTVLRSMQTLFNHGRLAGTGYLSILPVDQGVEHLPPPHLPRTHSILIPKILLSLPLKPDVTVLLPPMVF